MEYTFSIENCVEVLKTVDTSHTDLTGRQRFMATHPDCIITDVFSIKEKYLTKEEGGLCYDWYLLNDHDRFIDRTPQLIKEIDNERALVDYVAMMTDVDIPLRKEEAEDELV